MPESYRDKQLECDKHNIEEAFRTMPHGKKRDKFIKTLAKEIKECQRKLKILS